MAAGPPFTDRGLTGSASSSLHAKTFAIDRSHIFIGSLNFDPRSAQYNTEMGFVIKSATLAGRAAEVFENDVPNAAYRLQLDESGKLQWIKRKGDKEILHRKEPGMSWYQVLGIRTLSNLPIEGML